MGRAALAPLGAVLGAALVAVACSSAPHIVSSDELEAQRRRVLELEREVARARSEAATLRQRVAELERATLQPAPPPAPPAAPSAAVEAEPAPSSAPSAEPARPATSGIEESDLASELPPPSGAPGAASYEAALTALRERRYAEAERELVRFAAEQPGSDLADNAWFWLGESRLARGDAAGAIEAYRTAIERYPEGNKMPDTLLKLGTALEAAGDPDSAREAWQELVRRFPTSAAAEAAALRLAAQ